MGRSRFVYSRLTGVWITSMGLLGLLAGIGLLLGQPAVPVLAQDAVPSMAAYAGSQECRTCHQGMYRHFAETPHALALQDVRQDKSPLLADFSQDEALRQVQLPGESQPRAITADDIAYVIGTGRYIQRYLVDDGENGYLVLPVEWNTETGNWQSFELSAAWPDPAYEWGPNCAYCHTTDLNIETYGWMEDGVRCEMCHGLGSQHIELAGTPGMSHTSDQLSLIRAAIVLQPDSQICGQCHSRGTDLIDGHPYPTHYQPGMTLVEDGVFALIADDDPVHWWSTGHAKDTNMQFNEWLDTKHASATTDVQGSDYAQDACLACHSTEYGFTESIRALFADGTLKGTPPEAVTVEIAQGGVSCMTCHDPHDLAGDEPLLVGEPYALCVSCHRDTDLISTPHHPVKEMFEGQPMVAGLDGIPSAHFAAENGPDCLTCHMPEVPVSTFTLASHALRPVLPGAAENGPPDTCSGCHENLTTGDLQSLVDDTQSAVRERLSVAWARVASVTEPETGTDARALYDRAITALTFVQNDGSMGVHNYAYVNALLDSAGRDLAELSVPGSDLQPTEAPAPTATPSGAAIPIGETSERVRSGFRPITGVFIGLFAGVLLIGAAVLFRRRGREEA